MLEIGLAMANEVHLVFIGRETSWIPEASRALHVQLVLDSAERRVCVECPNTPGLVSRTALEFADSAASFLRFWAGSEEAKTSKPSRPSSCCARGLVQGDPAEDQPAAGTLEMATTDLEEHPDDGHHCDAAVRRLCRVRALSRLRRNGYGHMLTFPPPKVEGVPARIGPNGRSAPRAQAVGPNGRQTDRGGPDPTADPKPKRNKMLAKRLRHLVEAG